MDDALFPLSFVSLLEDGDVHSGLYTLGALKRGHVCGRCAAVLVNTFNNNRGSIFGISLATSIAWMFAM